MAGSKKKKSFTLIILLIAMIVLIAACYLLLKHKDKNGESNADENDNSSETILEMKEDTIAKIYFKNEDTEMTLVKSQEGTWTDDSDASFPVNQTYAQNMSKAFTNLTSSRTITDGVENLADFGLDDPKLLVKVTDKNGKVNKLCLGIEVPLTGGYYATLNDDGKVYVITSTVYNYFNYNRQQMTAVESLPSISTDNITYLLVEKKDQPGFEIQYDSERTSDFAGDSNWTIKQPYEKPISADGTKVSTLLENYSGLSFSSCVDYKATDLSQYGLDTPAARVYLEYYEEYTKDSDTEDDTTDEGTQDSDAEKEEEKTRIDYTLELLIGNQNEDGNYYVKTADSKAVHLMSSDIVEKMIHIDAFDIANHYINLVNIDSINKLDIKVEGKTYTLSIERTKATVDDSDANESEETDEEVTKYYFNGKEVEESPFKKLYQTIIAPTAEHEIPEEYFSSDMVKTPYMTLTYYLNEGGTIEIAYKPYDDSYFVANSNGIEYFLTDLRQVKDITNALESFTGKEK